MALAAANPPRPRPALAAIFRPADDAAANRILDLISTGQYSLREIAHASRTSLQALSVWLETSDATARLTTINAGVATATRLAAGNHLGSAVRGLRRVLEEYARAPRQVQQFAPDALRDRMLEARNAATAVRAAAILLRLSRITGAPPVARSATEPGKPAAQPGIAVAAAATPAALARTTAATPIPAHIPIPALTPVPAPAQTTVPAPASTATATAPSVRASAPVATAAPQSPAPATAQPLPPPAQSTTARATPESRPAHKPEPQPLSSEVIDALGELSDEELVAAINRGEIDADALLATAGFTAGPAP